MVQKMKYPWLSVKANMLARVPVKEQMGQGARLKTDHWVDHHWWEGGHPAPPYPRHRVQGASRPPPSPAPLWTACPWCPAITLDPEYYSCPRRHRHHRPEVRDRRLSPLTSPLAPPVHVPLFQARTANPETGTPSPLYIYACSGPHSIFSAYTVFVLPGRPRPGTPPHDVTGPKIFI